MQFIVNDKKFTKFTSYNIPDDYNKIAAEFSFSGFADDYSEFLYKDCEIRTDEGELVVFGKIHTISNTDDPTPSEPNIQGYSGCGILEDVHASLDSFPLERTNLNLEDLIRIYWGAYDIGYAVADPDYEKTLEPFSKVLISPTAPIKSEINKLVIQRGLFLSHIADGTPLLVGEPLKSAEIYDVSRYINSFAININGRNVHSKINIIKQASADNDGDIFTLTNEFVTEKRERNVPMKDGSIADMEGFARKIMSQEMLNASASFKCTKYVKIGNIIPIKNNNWFVTKVNITGDASGEVYSYTAVHESVYK